MKFLLPITALLLISMNGALIAQEETNSSAICNSETCIPFTITPYDKVHDEAFVAEIISNNQQSLPFTKNPQFLDSFVNHSKQLFTEPVDEKQHAAFDQEHPMFFEAHADILRIAGNPVGMVCYSITKMQKVQKINIGSISYLYASKDYELEITKAMIEYALLFMNQEKANMINAITFGDNDLQRQALKAYQFNYAATQESISVYMKVSEDYAQAMQQAAATEEAFSDPNILQLNPENVQESITSSKLPVILDLSASWCPPCRKLTPVLVNIAAENKDKIVVAKFKADDVQQSPYMVNLCKEYEIKGIPTLFFIKNDAVVGLHTGYLDEQVLQEKINQYFN